MYVRAKNALCPFVLILIMSLLVPVSGCVERDSKNADAQMDTSALNPTPVMHTYWEYPEPEVLE